MEEKKKEEKAQESQNAKKEKSNLNDIILDKINKDAKKTSINVKKILLTTASLILVFLIVLVVMKLVNSQNERNEVSLLPQNGGENRSSAVVEPAQVKDKEKVEKEEKELFKEVPVEEKAEKSSESVEEILPDEENDDEAFEEMVKNLKEKEKKSIASADNEVREVKESVSEPVEKSIKKEVVKETSAEVEPKKKESENLIKKSVEKVKEEVAKPVEEVKTVVKEEIHKQKPKKVTKIEGYFIQVSASFKTSPSKSFLKKIRDNGFNYIIKKSTVRGQKATKVLVGPFSSKKAALNALPKVKSAVNPDAFIVRMR